MKAVPISAGHLCGYVPRIGDDVVIQRAPRFYVRNSIPAWHRSSSVTVRVVSIDPLLAQPVKLTRTWKHVLTGALMIRERVLP